jgi:hypothetical protein
MIPRQAPPIDPQRQSRLARLHDVAHIPRQRLTRVHIILQGRGSIQARKVLHGPLVGPAVRVRSSSSRVTLRDPESRAYYDRKIAQSKHHKSPHRPRPPPLRRPVRHAPRRYPLRFPSHAGPSSPLDKRQRGTPRGRAGPFPGEACGAPTGTPMDGSAASPTPVTALRGRVRTASRRSSTTATTCPPSRNMTVAYRSKPSRYGYGQLIPIRRRTFRQHRPLYLPHAGLTYITRAQGIV